MLRQCLGVGKVIDGDEQVRWDRRGHHGAAQNHRNDQLGEAEELFRRVVLADRVLKGQVELVRTLNQCNDR